jgi:acetylornithine deacetylase/succinyl-diaminopimelate desuccinylase-like protein
VNHNFHQVFTSIEQNRQSFIDRLIEYLRMPSISARNEGMAEITQFLVTWLNRLGLNTRLENTPGWPIVMG